MNKEVLKYIAEKTRELICYNLLHKLYISYMVTQGYYIQI